MKESHDSEKPIIDNPLILPPGLFNSIWDFEAHYVVSKNEPIILLGATGVGKSLFLHLAKMFFKQTHKNKKKQFPIIEANCAHFNINLAQSELFGHVAGAFTDAKKDRKGLVEEANGGLLILEEIGELPLEVQAMLLTFIETGGYRRVGENELRRSNVKVIGATNREAALRSDFRYRFFPFYIPPLHERRGDILYYLYDKFPELAVKLNMSEVLVLLSYNWPGNVREVERVGRLLMREKWSNERSSAESSEPSNSDTPKLYYLDPRDVSFNPDASEELERDLAGWDIDLEFLEKLLNQNRIGISESHDNAFPELNSKEKTMVFSFFDEYDLRVYNRYEPFQEAYKGFTLFCALFLQDPSADANILNNLDNSKFKHSSLDDFGFSKSKKEKIDRLMKSIIKYLNRIDEDYRGPEKVSDFWHATEELKRDSLVEHQYLKHAELLRDPKDLREIWMMAEPDLLRFYYKGLLKFSGGNVTAAAKMSGLKATTFRERLNKYGVEFKRK